MSIVKVCINCGCLLACPEGDEIEICEECASEILE